MSIRKDSLIFDTMSLEGGLFVPELLERAAQGRADYQSDSDYQIHKGLKIQDEYGRAFQIALAEYQDFSRNILREDLDKYQTTEKFVYSILDILDYKNINERSFITCNDRTYPITADTSNKIAIVIAPANIDLDTADERFAVVGSGSHKKTPFHLAQEFLNASPEYLWAIVSNGRTIRLLRDSAAMTRPCYLEFDLEAILKDSCYSDFTGFWRILHASRSNSISTGNMAGKPIWEAWYQTGLEQGTRIRDGLRNAVTQALITIGCGFIAHQDNKALREKLQNGSLTSEAYFQQLLRFIYRMLFLFTTEERGILHTDDSSPEAIQARKIYEEGYSQKRLRKYSLRFTNLNRQDYQCDSYSDLWQAQQVVFRGLQHGEKALELPALGGIFASD
ncbi:MAG: SAM-dependent DNA methyltransferase, partial [Candidatus Riflebacteria bacterium]|nr:SAM-dependent DNA methyltransferase [Candidatus Riflebacteria bacterium]